MKRKLSSKIKKIGKSFGKELSHSRLGKATRTPIRVKKGVF